MYALHLTKINVDNRAKPALLSHSPPQKRQIQRMRNPTNERKETSYVRSRHHRKCDPPTSIRVTRIDQERDHLLVEAVAGRADCAARVVRAAVLEVWVHACLLGGQSVGGIVFEKRLQQGKAILLQTGDNGSIGTLPLGEGSLVIGERGDTGPFNLVGGAEDTVEERGLESWTH